MGTMLRNDFAQASSGLTLPAQKRNLAGLHQWLVDEARALDGEHVVALTNFQQGRFGRFPTHILLVTTVRMVFTHDGGIRAVSLDDIDTERVDVSAGIVHGEITIALRNGETLSFRRGMSLGMQEVAAALMAHGAPTPPSPVSHRADTPSSSSRTEITPGEGAQHGDGDGLVEFVDLITSPGIVAITGKPAGFGVFAVWALGPHLEHVELLVNTTAAYDGTRVFALRSPVRALKIETNGSWSVTPVRPDELPALGSGCAGFGDAVVTTPEVVSAEQGFPAHIELNSDPHETSAVSVWARGADTQLLVNGIAPYSGSVVIPPGTQFLEIAACARWAITRC